MGFIAGFIPSISTCGTIGASVACIMGVKKCLKARSEYQKIKQLRQSNSLSEVSIWSKNRSYDYVFGLIVNQEECVSGRSLTVLPKEHHVRN